MKISGNSLNSSPALTLKIQLSNDQKLDLDLVPVFAFHRKRLRKNDQFGMRNNIIHPVWIKNRPKNYRDGVKDGLEQGFFAIPRSGPNDLDWGIHFPSAEKKIIWDLGCVKPVIRYLKLFRDIQPLFAKVKSYALLTTVMKMIPEYPHDFWIENNVSFFLLEAFTKFQKVLQEGHLGWCFDDRCNILTPKYYPIETRQAMVAFLEQAIYDMKRGLEYWPKYFEA